MGKNLRAKILESPIILIYGFLFLAFLIPGLWLGQSIGIGNETQENEISSPVDQTQSPVDTGQRNLLVVGVDNIPSSLPRLLSIWLVIYFPGNPDTTLIPVYPQLIESDIPINNRIANSFSLQKDGQPGEVFFIELQKLIWWDDYIILDGYALTEWVETLGGIDLNNEHLDGEMAVEAILSSDPDIEVLVKGQAEFLDAVCKQMASDSLPESIEDYLLLSTDHIRSDADILGIFGDLLAIRGSSGYSANCEFPTLDIIRP